jgi:prepilin-type N-terminal cleavage/methylation domain-containing protein
MEIRKEEKGVTLIETITKKGGEKMKMLKGKKGFTLIEVIVILAVIAILAAVLTPMIIGYISDARVRAAGSDVKTMAVAVQSFNKDMGDWPIWAAGTARTAASADYDALRSNTGETPGVGTGVTIPTGADIDDIDDHLVTNLQAYPTTGRSKWVGPYLETVKQDPWGSKYYIDVKGLQPANVNTRMAAYVISAGPNKLLETAFGQTETSTVVFAIGGDDIVFRIK